MTDHDELRALAESATPGPWGARYFTDGKDAEARRFATAVEMSSEDAFFRLIAGADDSCLEENGTGDWLNLGFMGNGPTSGANAAYIAAVSPDVVVALLDEIAELRAALSVAVDEFRLADAATIIAQHDTASGKPRAGAA